MNAVVFGANGGIGAKLVGGLVARGDFKTVFAASRGRCDIDGAVSIQADPLDEDALKELAEKIATSGPLTMCICAVGLLSDDNLSPERSYRQQQSAAFERVFAVNTIAPALIAKHLLPLMPRKERAVFAALSARVGSISDNRLGGWHAYRASKAALNMLIKNYAIEQARLSDEFIAVGLHPGTVDTPLSKPFQKAVPAEQLFSPQQSASYLLDVIEGLSPQDTGKVFDWTGKEIPA